MNTSKSTDGKRKSKGTRSCPKCGAKVSGVILLCECGYHFQTESVIPVDPPLSRERHLIRVKSEASLPDYCVWCGQPTSHRVHKTFYWFPLWTHLLWLLSVPMLFYQLNSDLVLEGRLGALVPPGLLLYFFYTKRRSMMLDVPFCRACLLTRQKKLRIGAALLLGSVAAAAVLGIVTSNVLLALAIGCLVAGPGLIVFMMNKNLLIPTEIDNVNDFARFRGASERFLNQLPQVNR
jgi:hypothetical protein